MNLPGGSERENERESDRNEDRAKRREKGEIDRLGEGVESTGRLCIYTRSSLTE